MALLETIPQSSDTVVVGHSAGGLLAAWLASKLSAHSLICLDASMPPESGATGPAEPWFYDFVHSLPQQNGHLPPWNLWWESDILENTQMSPVFKETFIAELPTLHIDWFDDSFDMPDWSSCQRGFLQTSSVFEKEAARAKKRGWHVRSIQGTHLHPALKPDETADALIELFHIMSKNS